MPETTDRDVAHFLAEHWELLRLVFMIVKNMKWRSSNPTYYRDERACYGAVITSIREKPEVVGDFESTKQALKMLLFKWEMMQGVTDYKGMDEDDKPPFTNGCPFMRG